MADEPDNLVLQYLRRIDTKLDRVSEDVRDIKVRLTAVDVALAGVNRRIDRLELRVDRDRATPRPRRYIALRTA